jgi:DNA-binding GntR family transcriptional regulator
MATDSDANKPRYRVIIEALRHRIEQGDYNIDDRLPTEKKLCEQFAVSRHTVREALRKLQEIGLIMRRQGSGSIVVRQQASDFLVNAFNSIDDIHQYASSTHLQPLSVDRLIAEADLAEKLGCEKGTQWFRINALRQATTGALSLAYTEVYIDVAFGSIPQKVGVEQSAIYTMIEREYGLRVEVVTQDIEAKAADANVASRLNVKIGTPVLVLMRRYFSEGGRLIEVAVNTHPGDRYSYQLRLHRKN